MRVHGPAVFEDAIHVPLVFLQPSLGQPHVVDSPAILADIYPTLLDLLAVAPREGLDGVSLARTIQPRSIMVRAMQGWPAAHRSGPDKVIIGSPQDRGTLYQLEKDPIEGDDISSTQPEVSKALRARLLYEVAQRSRTDPSVEAKWRPAWVPEARRGPGATSSPKLWRP